VIVRVEGDCFVRVPVWGALFLIVALAVTATRGAESVVGSSFVGLDGVTVYVEEPDSTFVERGITMAVIQTPVELLLRQNGIPVLNEGDPGLTAGNPVLYVMVTGVINEEMHQYAYQIQMELTQTVTLERDPELIVDGAMTWRTGGVALSGPQWRESLLTDLDGFATEFVQAYFEGEPGE
jgi:hypothetical protein